MSGLPYIARPVYGLRRPKVSVRGTDVAGTVEATGAAVTQVKAGDEVFGASFGSYAEYAAAPESSLAAKPANSGACAYNQSNLANVMFTYELAKRLEGTGVTRQRFIRV